MQTPENLEVIKTDDLKTASKQEFSHERKLFDDNFHFDGSDGSSQSFGSLSNLSNLSGFFRSVSKIPVIKEQPIAIVSPNAGITAISQLNSQDKLLSLAEIEVQPKYETSSQSKLLSVPVPPTIEEVGSTLATPNANNQLLLNTAPRYVDITEYLNLPQSTAAKKMGIPASTLSKRWKEAVRNRKWPYRTVSKIDKEISTLLHNIPPGVPIPADIESNLGLLLRKRQEELRAVIIRL